jgi:hypothetical protein
MQVKFVLLYKSNQSMGYPENNGGNDWKGFADGGLAPAGISV